MPTTVVELTGDEAALLRSYDRAVKKQAELEAKLRDGGMAGDAAGTQIEGALKRVEEANQKAMKGLLDDLKKLGPEGRKAADEIRTKLVEAGKLSEKSIDSIADAFGKIDPAVGATAKEIVDKMKSAGTEVVADSKQITDGLSSHYADFGQKAVGELKAVFAAYVGVNGVTGAIDKVIEHIDKQLKKTEEARKAQISLASAQQETVKNLIGSDALSQNKLLRKDIFDIATTTGFADLGSLTTAFGAAISTGATEKQALDALRAGAQMNRHKPANLAPATQAALLIGQATGIDDAAHNMNLAMTAADPALIDDTGKLMQVLPTAITNVMATTTDTNKERASLQATALFAALGKKAGDRSGDSTITNEIKLAGYMRTFFKDIADDPGTLKARFEYLHQNEDERNKFLAKMPAEEQFKIAFEQMLDPNSDTYKDFLRAESKLSLGREGFDRTANQLETATLPLVVAGLDSRVKAAVNVQEATSPDTLLAQIRSSAAEALQKTQGGLVESFGQDIVDSRIPYGSLHGSTALEEGLAAVERMKQRIFQLEAGGVTASEQGKIATLNASILAIERALAGGLSVGAITGDDLTAARGTAFRAPYLNDVIAGPGAGNAIQSTLSAMLDRLDKIAKSNAQMAADAATPPPATAALGAEQP